MKPIALSTRRRSIEAAIAVPALCLSLAGCAVAPIASGGPNAVTPAQASPKASVPNAQAVVRIAEDANNRYLRLDAASTGLLNVADDGKTTFAVFVKELTDLRVFDQEGKPLRHVRLRQLVAIEGRHPGLLLKAHTGASFAAPNPRAPAAPLPSLSSDPDVAEARTLLEAQGTHKANFDRALALADKPAIAAKAATEVPRPSPIVVAPAMLPPPASDDTYVRQATGILMRVFFASGGRAVVRPDDGLVRLVREAQGAQQIRITGYTDSLGTASANTVLAQQRAEAIRHHLVRSGVPADRILLGWTGATDFLAENTTERGRAMNRRVEVQMVLPTIAQRK